MTYVRYEPMPQTDLFIEGGLEIRSGSNLLRNALRRVEDLSERVDPNATYRLCYEDHAEWNRRFKDYMALRFAYEILRCLHAIVENTETLDGLLGNGVAGSRQS